MKKLFAGFCAATVLLAFTAPAATNQVLGWNNLGMHCMDSDYSVFSILPPYNTIEAQLIVAGKLVTNGTGYSVTYQAVADPAGSINSTAAGKGNYRAYFNQLYTTNTLPEDMGLAGWGMPGSNNVPQPMFFEATNRPAPGVATKVNWLRAEGIPITPYDDAGQKNPYPLMRLIAKSGAIALATNDIVLPVSDEMDCRTCHASGSSAAAEPAAGWVWAANQERDFRLNILRLHDERNFAQHHDLYVAALADRGYNPQGLYRGVVANNQPVLCANCHASEALGTPSFGTIPQLTTSIHAKHAAVMDPDLHITLDNSANRAACYRCHPGATTRCLRGAMGGAVAADGSMEMQCQSCHGNMSQVGSSSRVGWFMEPNCQSCHSGTASSNSGQIRYASAFVDANGTVRVPANQTFATQTNCPAPGLSLYRFSSGHGGLQCSACHGSTHAEFPATHRNDNLRNERIQGHAGVMVECTSCHVTMPSTITGGPHGMHPVGSSWVNDHPGAAENNRTQCQACHGTDYRGTVLSRMQADRTLSAFGTKIFFRGAILGCYTCHNGPTSETANNNANPIATGLVTNTVCGVPVTMMLPISGAGATGRIISQPEHGSVGLAGTTATYFPEAGFVGTDTFTFAAYDGAKNSLLATGKVVVAQGPFSLGVATRVPAKWTVRWPAPFNAVPAASNVVGVLTYDWNFGDGSPHDPRQFATHTYTEPGTYNWTLTSTVTASTGNATAVNSGIIEVPAAASVVMTPTVGSTLTLTWALPAGDALLEETDSLSAPNWSVVANGISSVNGETMTVVVPINAAAKFYRLRQL